MNTIISACGQTDKLTNGQAGTTLKKTLFVVGHRPRATRQRLTRLLALWGAQTRFLLQDRLPEWTGTLAESRQHEKAEGASPMEPMTRPGAEVEVSVRKPAGGHSDH